MYTLTIELRKEMEQIINATLGEATSSDYSMSILNSEIKTHQNKVCKMMDMIIDDIVETSAFRDKGYYGISDVRFAIGRCLRRCLNMLIENPET